MTTVRWCATTYPPRPVPGITFNPCSVFVEAPRNSQSRSTLSVTWPPSINGTPVRCLTCEGYNGPQPQFTTRHPQRRDS